jgi:hypothetical protein
VEFARLVALLAPDEDPRLVDDLADRCQLQVIPHPRARRFSTLQAAT